MTVCGITHQESWQLREQHAQIVLFVIKVSLEAIDHFQACFSVFLAKFLVVK
jgi:hypothetical protein